MRAAIVLGALMSLALAGCYAPDVRDCVVTCTPGDSCADGERCGSDGFCAAPAVAGTCAAHDEPDAAVAPTTIMLHIMVMGSGRVVLDNDQTCDTAGSDNGDCMFAVPSHTAANLVAMDLQLGHPFLMWTGMGCAGVLASCTFTPTAATTIGAMFK